ncbi:MAG: glycosyltransferase [Anaerolineae bacterium]|nr:glycosyltransferase [Anaerolineae bacterium]
MNIVVLGHNQVDPCNRVRWARLAECYPDARVTVLPPRYWMNHSYGRRVEFVPAPERHGNYRVIPLGVVAPGSGRYVYRSLDLRFRQLKPDIIWVYADPQTYVMPQVILYKKLYAPDARIICCTSTNVPSRLDRFDRVQRHRFALRNLAAFSTGTQEVIDRLHAEGVTQPILHRVITGADERHWRPGDEPELRRRLGLGDFVVGFVGRHEHAKGLPDLVAALEGLEGAWSFLSLGDGPFKAEAERRLKAARGGRGVQLCGYVPHVQTPPYYRCMDVLVLVSRQVGVTREPAGVVIMEANLSRVVSVVSDLPGPAEIAGDSGIVIPEGDVARLRDGLRRLRDDPAERARRAEASYRRALDAFGATAIARDTYAFCQELMSR